MRPVIRLTQAIGITLRLLAPTLTAAAATAHSPRVAPAKTEDRVVPRGQVRGRELGDVAPLGQEDEGEAGRRDAQE